MSSGSKDQHYFSDLGTGLGLRPTHFQDVLEGKPGCASWFEAISENYMAAESGSGGQAIQVLEKVRHNYPVVLHGVSLSIGSTDPLNLLYLRRLKDLIHRISPAWVSDHLCWTGVQGENLHDLLPLPFTEEALEHLVPRIQQVQDFIGQRMLFENVSSYLTFKHSEMKEWEFLAELSRRADCGILLDLNNIYVSSVNQGFSPMDFLNGIPGERIGQLHLAGHSSSGNCLIDTHDHPVSEPVWDLYRETLKKHGGISTLVEWDASIPEYSVLLAEAERAEQIRAEALKPEVRHAHPASQPIALSR
jgi:uncharacterized protein (UPF0276 family)